MLLFQTSDGKVCGRECPERLQICHGISILSAVHDTNQNSFLDHTSPILRLLRTGCQPQLNQLLMVVNNSEVLLVFFSWFVLL